MTAAKATAQATANYLPVRPDWLALASEVAIEPDLPIIDAHHHLWDRHGWRFLMDAYLDEVSTSGHRIVGSVFMQCQTAYDASLPPHMRPVGETAYVAREAERVRSALQSVCSGIVGHADLRLGAAVEEVLLGHMEADATRFRGIRHITVWDADASLMNPLSAGPPALLDDARFIEGFARLAPLGLSFDAWLFQPQLDELTALARRFPDTTIVLDHLGGLLGIGAYRGRKDELFQSWARSIRRLADCPNVVVKIGGLGMRINGFGFELRARPPTSAELAHTWRPYVETAIAAFGPARCMFESNAPVDRGSYAVTTGWNALKILTQGMAEGERAELFAGTARRVYRLAV